MRERGAGERKEEREGKGIRGKCRPHGTVHQLLDLLHVSVDTCCLGALKPSLWALPQLQSGPLKKQRSGLLFFLPWRPGRPSPPSPQPVPSSWSMGAVVAKLLLPTLSSLAFLPTVSIAAKRQFYMEAMVYLFTMFFVVVSGSLGGRPHGEGRYHCLVPGSGVTGFGRERYGWRYPVDWKERFPGVCLPLWTSVYPSVPGIWERGVADM